VTLHVPPARDSLGAVFVGGAVITAGVIPCDIFGLQVSVSVNTVTPSALLVWSAFPAKIAAVSEVLVFLQVLCRGVSCETCVTAFGVCCV
jgi:hypothetical protein